MELENILFMNNQINVIVGNYRALHVLIFTINAKYVQTLYLTFIILPNILYHYHYSQTNFIYSIIVSLLTILILFTHSYLRQKYNEFYFKFSTLNTTYFQFS